MRGGGGAPAAAPNGAPTRMKPVGVRLGLLAATLALAAPAHARPGDVDPSFGTGGESLIRLNGKGAGFGGMAMRRDGSILAIGYAPGADSETDHPRPVLLDLGPAGLLRRSFGEGGAVRLPMTLTADPVVQRDGKIVVAGSLRSNSGVDQLVVVRLEADGDRDREFGNNGVVTPTAGAGLWPHSAIVQEDGKLVAAGGVVNPNGLGVDNFTLVRLRSDGSTDRGFGDGGRVVTPTGEANGHASSIIEQADGRLVVGGTSLRNVADEHGSRQYSTWLVRRYQPDGGLDRTFGSNGETRLDFANNTGGELASLVETEDGPLLGVGDAWFERGFMSARFALARFGRNGGVDGEFGSAGSVLTQVPAEQTGNLVAAQAFGAGVQDDGRIVAVGRYFSDIEFNSYGWAVVRYRRDGSLDSSFGRDGFVTSVRGPVPAAERVVVQPGGRLVVAGTSVDCGRDILTLVRYFADAGTDGGPAMHACATTIPLGPDDELPVTVQCPFVEDECNGTLTVEIPPAELTSSSHTAKRAVKLGAAKFRLTSGARGKASVDARGRGGRLLRKKRTTRAVLVFVARDGDGHRRVTRRSVKVRATR